MSARVLLSRHLAELCWDVCERCSLGRPVPTAPAPDPADVAALRRNWVRLPRSRCDRCEFILLLEAIDHLVPADDLADWLSRASPDLDGRTPAECIALKEYDPVFRALFLLDPDEPVVAS